MVRQHGTQLVLHCDIHVFVSDDLHFAKLEIIIMFIIYVTITLEQNALNVQNDYMNIRENAVEACNLACMKVLNLSCLASQVKS